MLSTPQNLKTPKNPLILKDYKRDTAGNIYTQDGSLLQVDANKNLKRDANKNLILLDGTTIPCFTE